MGSLRTLLALAVVFSHTSSAALVGGRNAVQLFYIISGFLISYVLTEVKSYKTVKAFYINRYLRLFPIAYTLKRDPDFFATYTRSPVSAGAVLVVANVTLFFQDWVMFLGVREGHLQFVKDFSLSDPQLYKGLLAWQAWTLGVELTFYAIAPFLLKDRRWICIALVASLGMRGVFVLSGFGQSDPWTYRFFPTELALFLLGSLSHQILLPRFRRLAPARARVVAYAATGGMMLLCIVYPFVTLAESIKTVALLGVFVALAPATFEFQRTTKWDNFIGSLSYPIYISHMLVLWIVHHVFWHFGWSGDVAIATATVVMSIVAAYTLDRLVGGPVERFRARVRARSDPVQSNAIAPLVPSI